MILVSDCVEVTAKALEEKGFIRITNPDVYDDHDLKLLRTANTWWGEISYFKCRRCKQKFFNTYCSEQPLRAI